MLETRPRACPSVGVAVGDVTDQNAKIIGKDGKPLGDGPVLRRRLRRRHAGRRAASRRSASPTAAGPPARAQVVIDQKTAEDEGYGVGDRVKVTGAARPRPSRSSASRASARSSRSARRRPPSSTSTTAQQAVRQGRRRRLDPRRRPRGRRPAPHVRAALARELGSVARRSRRRPSTTASRSTAWRCSSRSSASSCSPSAAWRSSSAR